MSWSAQSAGEARHELSLAISAELARAREALAEATDLASSVHEARRAIKRARALLRLADPWPADSIIECSLRDANRALAVLRDADVVALTAEDILKSSGDVGPSVLPRLLLESLEAERERRFSQARSADGPLRAADELLRPVVVEIGEFSGPESIGGYEQAPFSGWDFLRIGLGASYASARARSDPTVGEGPADERSHKLRKRVKDLRYQLEFLDTGHPELGRVVEDLHRLTDLLGDRNDLAVLSAHAASVDGLEESERATLSIHVEGLKQPLRSEAEALSARLFQDEPDDLVGRIEAWITSPQG